MTEEQREKQRKYYREWRSAHKSKVKEYRAKRLLAHKAEVQEYGREWYRAHKLEIGKSRALSGQTLKDEVLSHYSGTNPPTCKVCGENDIDVLCLDHIVNGGVQQRKLSGNTGVRFYRRLKKQGFPKGFQVLCANCNMKKAMVYRRNG